MKAEFAQDDLGTIWFIYASNIQVRPKKLADSDLEEDMRKKAKPKTDKVAYIGKSGQEITLEELNREEEEERR